MFIQQIFEAAAPRVIVTYPGRFQPFHKGHAEVFASLQRKYGGDNVFIVTSNKTDAAKSPFNFSDKVQFMHAMGVPNHNIVQADQVYDLPAAFNNIKDQVVFITVIGKPDEKRLQPGRIKKDGTPGYFQPLPSSAAEFQTADKHGYVIVEPEHPKSIAIGGKTYDVSHGTPTRELWNQVRNNPKQRQEFIQGLYGVNDPELGRVLDKIPTGAAPAPAPAAKMKNVKKDLSKVQHDPNAVAESNGYEHGFADPNAPQLGAQGKASFKSQELRHELGHEQNNLAIAINGKVWKVIPGKGYADSFEERSYLKNMQNWAAKKSASSGKKWTVHLTGAPITVDESWLGGVKSAVGPWFLKKDGDVLRTVNGEPFTFKSKEEAVKWAMKTYKVSYNQQRIIPTTNPDKNLVVAENSLNEFAPPGSNDGGDDGFSDETLKRLAAQWYNGDEDPRVERTLMAAGWEIGQDEGYDDEPGVFVVQAGDVNGNSYMSWPAHELKQGVAESKYKCTCHPGDADPDCPVHGLEPMEVGDALDVKKDVAEAKAATASFRAGNKKRAELNAMSDEERRAHDKEQQEKQRKRDDARLERERQKLADKKRVAEGTGNIGSQIKALYQKIYNAGDDAIEFMYYDSPIFAQYWDEYEGDLDSIIAEVDPSELQIIYDELVSAAENEGLAESGLGLDHKRNRFKSLRTVENAEELNIGDDVIITGDVQFQGKTGVIDSFGDMKRFVIVNLYNHGKHSFHSSDVSYNDYADREDDLDEDMYQYDAQDPYNSEFAPRAGMGRMTLRGWKQSLIRRTAELAQQMAAAGQDIDKAALWDNVYKQLKAMNMDPIAQEIELAHSELEKIRRRGGVRSRAFNK